MRHKKAKESNKRGLFYPEGGYNHTFRVGERAYDMPIGVVSNRPMSRWQEEPPVIYLPTYGERAECSARTVEACDTPVVVFASHGSDIPHQIGCSPKEALERALRETFPEFVRFVLEQSKTDEIGVAGGSAGGAKIGFGLRETSGEGIGSIGLWNPLGLSNWTGEGVELSARQFVARFAWSGRRISPFQPGIIAQTTEQLLEVLDDTRADMFMNAMDIANRSDFRPEYVSHAKRGKQVLIISGARDPLFPTEDIVLALERATPKHPKAPKRLPDGSITHSFVDGNLLVRQVPGLAHVTSVLESGQKAALDVIEFARSV